MPTILLADDCDYIRRMLRFFLEDGLGHRVVEAEDGDAALRLARATPVDVFVCDMHMPGRGGLETIPAFRAEFPGVPVVAISGGMAGADLLAAARELGASRLLHKPFSL